MIRYILFTSALFASVCLFTPAFAQDAPSPLTHGNVQMNLKTGITTQNEVLEKFGPPNIMTMDANNLEVWTYQKMATTVDTKSKSSYATLLLLGTQGETYGLKQSSKTMTLIIKFDASKTVCDFKSFSSSF